MTFALGAGLALVASYVAAFYGIQLSAVSVSPPPPPSAVKPPQQTEVLFLNGFKSLPAVTDEWWSARSDHRLVAHAIFNCKQPPGTALDVMPRQHFTALLLDLTPGGTHVFMVKDDEAASLAVHAKDAQPLVLSSSEQEILSLSDSIARVRLAAADGANTNVPFVQGLGLATLIVSALATLFVTLQSKIRAIELSPDEAKKIDHSGVDVRLMHALVGPGSGFRWVAFLAVALSITGTSLTGLKQVYDPTRILTLNTRSLLDLRQLHQDVILSVQCDLGRKAIKFDSTKVEEWTTAIRRARSSVIPHYGAYASVDAGSFQPRQPQPSSGQGKEEAPTSGPTTPAK